MSYAERLTKVAQTDLPGLVDEIRKIAVFTDLPQEHLEWFVSNCMEARFAAGEVVYKEGTPAEYMSVFLEAAFSLAANPKALTARSSLSAKAMSPACFPFRA